MYTTKKYDLSRDLAEFMTLRSERTEWQSEWQQISDYLLPGRGIYTYMSKPRKRKLTSPKVVNTTARAALRVLTSGLQGGLTSPSRPWLALSWQDPMINTIGPLKDWLFEAQRILEYSLQQSNFYPTMHSFYTEYAGFGTASIYVGADSDVSPFRFELLTAGEYAFSTNSQGRADKFFRTLFMTPRQMEERFGAGCSDSIKDMNKRKSPSRERKYMAVLECICPQKRLDMPYSQVFWEVGGANNAFTDGSLAGVGQRGGASTPLQVNGFHEFPYPVARWDLIGPDIYGMGPGSEALPEIKRLQEMTKGSLMATHKELNPPLNVPAYMKGKVSAMPGAYNYYKEPNSIITSIYGTRANFQAAHANIEIVEQRIKELFFNDIFLTASRDPNASPMKAAEVHVKDGEKMLRLGPVIERLQNEFIEPVVERCFNICLRKGLFPPLPPELAELAGDFQIDLVSPLAQAQKLVASKSIESVMAFAGQAAQISPTVMDKFNVDRSVDEYVDAHGAPRTMLNSDEEVAQIREQRAKEQQAKQAQEQQVQQQAMGMQQQQMQADTRKTTAEAGQIMAEGLADAQQLGGVM